MAENDTDTAKLKAEIEKLRKDFASVAETLKELSSEQARESVAHLRHQAEQTGEKIEAEIRERPLTSVATAFALGFILARLLNR
ncbi:ElaB/YqjD/DUF883 family membrane-anchored ribosome-binding protein [Methylohalomonas lacus]|uniref:ElaB/YqjD/DUF883 family membrane-anchored ribosome-binding protein n=1 Tax=Methylohalomonas lacus TaxID=398773 RepID=A0AAE3HL46_9GAMM|nr:hypothetical protein [Methylohalomonas lacus]MCS3903136.1 ElaB/YqjD/DUF883 family membrane-anchored ribosome-binding protein [Methylohalomonas lacus]